MDESHAAVTVSDSEQPKATVTATATCRPGWLDRKTGCPATGTAHIVLAVTDDGVPRMTSYRRVILNVHAE